jgi:hypothetical protein
MHVNRIAQIADIATDVAATLSLSFRCTRPKEYEYSRAEDQ